MHAKCNAVLTFRIIADWIRFGFEHDREKSCRIPSTRAWSGELVHNRNYSCGISTGLRERPCILRTRAWLWWVIAHDRKCSCMTINIRAWSWVFLHDQRCWLQTNFNHDLHSDSVVSGSSMKTGWRHDLFFLSFFWFSLIIFTFFKYLNFYQLGRFRNFCSRRECHCHIHKQPPPPSQVI